MHGILDDTILDVSYDAVCLLSLGYCVWERLNNSVR